MVNKGKRALLSGKPVNIERESNLQTQENQDILDEIRKDDYYEDQSVPYKIKEELNKDLSSLKESDSVKNESEIETDSNDTYFSNIQIDNEEKEENFNYNEEIEENSNEILENSSNIDMDISYSDFDIESNSDNNCLRNNLDSQPINKDELPIERSNNNSIKRNEKSETYNKNKVKEDIENLQKEMQISMNSENNTANSENEVNGNENEIRIKSNSDNKQNHSGNNQDINNYIENNDSQLKSNELKPVKSLEELMNKIYLSMQLELIDLAKNFDIEDFHGLDQSEIQIIWENIKNKIKGE